MFVVYAHSGHRSALKKQGYRVHSRVAVVDGVRGTVLWAEPIDEGVSA